MTSFMAGQHEPGGPVQLRPGPDGHNGHGVAMIRTDRSVDQSTDLAKFVGGAAQQTQGQGTALVR